jgi:hypothetical protein
MELLGLSNTEVFARLGTFSEKNLDRIDMSQHGPAFHMFCAGLSCFYLQEKNLWKKFLGNYRSLIEKSQDKDGAILVKPRDGSCKPMDEAKGFGPVYTTANYVILLQLHKGKLLFDKLKPVKKGG